MGDIGSLVDEYLKPTDISVDEYLKPVDVSVDEYLKPTYQPTTDPRVIEDMYTTQKAKGVFNKFMTHFQTTDLGIGTILTLADLTKKDMFKDWTQTGRLKLSPDDYNILMSAADDDIYITMHPNIMQCKTLDELEKLTGTRDLMRGGDKTPMALVITTGKEYEEIIKRKPVKGFIRKITTWEKEKRAFLKERGPEVKTKVKLGETETRVIPTNITIGDINSWMEEIQASGKSRRREVVDAGIQASMKAFIGQETRIEYTTEGGIKRVRPDIVASQKIAMPAGTPGRQASLAAAFATEIALPIPEELLLLPLKAANIPLKVAEKLYKTPMIKAVGNAVNNIPITRWLLRWFGASPEQVKTTYNALYGTKAYIGTAKEAYVKKIQTLQQIMAREAAERGKKYRPPFVEKMEWKLDKWYRGEKGKSFLDDWLKPKEAGGKGKTMDDFWSDTHEVAKQLGIREKALNKKLHLGDMRSFLSKYEAKVNYRGEALGKRTSDILQELQEITTRTKVAGKMIDEQAVLKYGPGAEQRYWGRSYIGQRQLKGEAFSTTAFKPGPQHKRVLSTYKDWEKAILLSKDGGVPNYNIIRAVAMDMEQATNMVMQNTIEDLMRTGGAMSSVRRVKPFDIKAKPKTAKTPGQARKYVLKHKEYLPDNMPIKKRMTDTDWVHYGNTLMREPRRILAQVDDGLPTINVLEDSVKQLENSINMQPGRGFLRQVHFAGKPHYSIYYPKSKMRIFRTDFKKEAQRMMDQGKSKVSVEELNKKLEPLADLLAKDELSSADYEKFMAIFADPVLQKAAPKSTAAITSRVPAYVTSREIGNIIKKEVRTVLDPAVKSVFRFLRKIERPFMSAVTSYNPNFWQKYLRTDVFQMWKSDVPLWRVPGRLTQGMFVQTGKGSIALNGVRFSNRELFTQMGQYGVLKRIRGMLSTERFDVLSQAVTDMMHYSIPAQKMRKAIKVPNTVLSFADDGFRIGTFIDFIEREAKRLGLRTKDEIVGLFPQAARWTWLHHFNYDDLPHVLKKARALVPFISWKYHIIPDQIKFLFKLDKMRKLSNATLGMQNLIGEPSVPLAADYLKRSPDLKFAMDGKVYRLNLNLPYTQILDFQDGAFYFHKMFSASAPVVQLIFALANLETFPKLGWYGKRGVRETVPMPLSMALYFKAFMNNPTFQKRTGATVVSTTDDDGDIMSYVAVSKKFHDIYHYVCPWVIPLDENSKNIKLFVDREAYIRHAPQQTLQELVRADVYGDELHKKMKEHKQPFTFTDRSRVGIPYYSQKRTAGGMAVEIDVAGGFKRSLQYLKSLEQQLTSQHDIAVSSNLKEMYHEDYFKYMEMAEDFINIKHELDLYLSDDPEDFEGIKDELDRRAEVLSGIISDMKDRYYTDDKSLDIDFYTP